VIRDREFLAQKLVAIQQLLMHITETAETFERRFWVVISTDRRNTIILTQEGGVFADEKKVQTCWVHGSAKWGAMGSMAEG
jgi:hypothetical protein